MNFYFYLSKILSPLLSIVNFLFFFLIIIITFYFFLKKKFLKKIIKFLFFIIFFISFIPIGSFFLKSIEKKYYKQVDYKNIDAIVVLAGNINTTKTSEFKKITFGNSSERLVSFVKLSHIYKNAELIYLGGKPLLDNNGILSESDAVRIFFKNINFDYKDVIFLSDSRNTIENLKSLKNYLKNKHFDKILLITSAFHMNRALLIANKLKLNVLPYAVDFKTTGKQNILNTWQYFSVINNLRTIDLFFRELLGFLVVKIIL